MAQYIDKSALVAEIEKRKKRNVLNEGAFEEDIDILSFIKNLEVKEVDFIEEFNNFVDFIEEFNNFVDRNKFMAKDIISISDMEKTASYFYELGLKAQKGE